jgi:hypothetical protein
MCTIAAHPDWWQAASRSAYSWAGAGAGAELAAELAGGSEYPSFPKIFPDKKFVLPMHRTMISDLAIELCERLADGKTGTLSWQYFKLPIDADVWAGYCENGGVSFAVTASGVRQILNSFVAMIKKTVRVINMPGTNQLLFSGKASGFHVRHEKAKARAESWIAAATKYLLEGDGSEGPLFFAPPAAPWNSDDFDDDVAATAYTCPGFPYGYMGNDFDLQL